MVMSWPSRAHRVSLTGQIFLLPPPAPCVQNGEESSCTTVIRRTWCMVHGYMIQQTRTSRHAAFQTRKADGRQRGLCFGRQHRH